VGGRFGGKKKKKTRSCGYLVMEASGIHQTGHKLLKKLTELTERERQKKEEEKY